MNVERLTQLVCDIRLWNIKHGHKYNPTHFNINDFLLTNKICLGRYFDIPKDDVNLLFGEFGCNNAKTAPEFVKFIESYIDKEIQLIVKEVYNTSNDVFSVKVTTDVTLTDQELINFAKTVIKDSPTVIVDYLKKIGKI